jgi:hypothetical protein
MEGMKIVMGTYHSVFASRVLSGACVALLFAMALASQSYAGARVYDSEDFTLELGLRMQPQLRISKFSGFGDDNSRQRDFMIRRARIKANGKMMGATYSLEWRLDATGLISGLILTAPIAGVENAWLQFPLLKGGGLDIRAGLYDQPYSRDRLTSDSKTLAVDRGLVSSVPAILGLADNAIGVDLRGKFQKGRYGYVAGVYDNRTIPGRFQPDPMFVGRVDVNLGSSKNVYRDAHFGDDSWYSLGLNGSYQNAIEDTTDTGAVVSGGRNTAVGVDGMIDVPLGPGRLFAMAEFNNIQQRNPGTTALIDTRVWGTGIGYLFWDQRLQPIVRFDQVFEDDGGEINQTHIGANYYRRGHNLKVQGDVVLIAGNGESFDRFRLQAQIDF